MLNSTTKNEDKNKFFAKHKGKIIGATAGLVTGTAAGTAAGAGMKQISLNHFMDYILDKWNCCYKTYCDWQPQFQEAIQCSSATRNSSDSNFTMQCENTLNATSQEELCSNVNVHNMDYAIGFWLIILMLAFLGLTIGLFVGIKHDKQKQENSEEAQMFRIV